MSGDAGLTLELRLLAYTAFICMLLWVPYVLAVIKTRGMTKAVSYPSGVSDDLPAWGQRANRAHMNLVENIAPFAILVLVAHAIGVNNEMTVLGAHLFFWGRVVQTVVMLFGIPWVRTLSFTVSLIGNLIIFGQIMYA